VRRGWNVFPSLAFRAGGRKVAACRYVLASLFARPVIQLTSTTLGPIAGVRQSLGYPMSPSKASSLTSRFDPPRQVGEGIRREEGEHEAKFLLQDDGVALASGYTKASDVPGPSLGGVLLVRQSVSRYVCIHCIGSTPRFNFGMKYKLLMTSAPRG